MLFVVSFHSSKVGRSTYPHRLSTANEHDGVANDLITRRFIAGLIGLARSLHLCNGTMPCPGRGSLTHAGVAVYLLPEWHINSWTGVAVWPHNRRGSLAHEPEQKWWAPNPCLTSIAKVRVVGRGWLGDDQEVEGRENGVIDRRWRGCGWSNSDKLGTETQGGDWRRVEGLEWAMQGRHRAPPHPLPNSFITLQLLYSTWSWKTIETKEVRYCIVGMRVRKDIWLTDWGCCCCNLK